MRPQPLRRLSMSATRATESGRRASEILLTCGGAAKRRRFLSGLATAAQRRSFFQIPILDCLPPRRSQRPVFQARRRPLVSHLEKATLTTGLPMAQPFVLSPLTIQLSAALFPEQLREHTPLARFP